MRINGPWLRSNQGVGAILTALVLLFMAYLWASPWTHRRLQDGFTLGFFPMLGTGLILFLALTMILDSKRGRTESGMHSVDGKTFPLCLLLLAGCWLCFEAADRIGFLLAAPPFLLVYVYALGMRPWTGALAVSVGMTAIVYGVFRFLGVELPTGPLPF